MCLHCQTPSRPLEIETCEKGLWRCSYCSETQTDANLNWVLHPVSVSVFGVRQCKWTINNRVACSVYIHNLILKSSRHIECNRGHLFSTHRCCQLAADRPSLSVLRDWTRHWTSVLCVACTVEFYQASVRARRHYHRYDHEVWNNELPDAWKKEHEMPVRYFLSNFKRCYL